MNKSTVPNSALKKYDFLYSKIVNEPTEEITNYNQDLS